MFASILKAAASKLTEMAETKRQSRFSDEEPQRYMRHNDEGCDDDPAEEVEDDGLYDFEVRVVLKGLERHQAAEYTYRAENDEDAKNQACRENHGCTILGVRRVR